MHRALQAGQRGFFLSVNGIMASINSIKDTDTPRLLLLGLLLPSVLVPSVGTETPSSPSVPQVTSASMTAMSESSTTMDAPMATTGNQGGSPSQPAATTTTITQAMATDAASPSPLTSTTGSSLSTTTTSNQPPATTILTATTTIMKTTAATPGGTPTTTTQSSTTPSGVGSTMTSSAIMAASTASQTPVTGSMSSMMSTDQTTATSDMTTMDVTNSGNTTAWMTMLYCPSFTCKNSDCYTMYTSQNTTACNSSCRLWRMDMYHTVGCSDSCADSCVNTSQINCSVNCCNYSGCLNDSFAMMMTITTGSATTTMATTPTPPMTATSKPITPDKGNKCHNGSCQGADCYMDFKNKPLQTCSSQHPHCQLMKETSDSKVMWKAGCTNCTNYTACKASTTPPCNMECCNATMTSCLMLNGTLNVPSFAARGLCVHKELMASLLGLLAIALLL